jgi:hypothetical protein
MYSVFPEPSKIIMVFEKCNLLYNIIMMNSALRIEYVALWFLLPMVPPIWSQIPSFYLLTLGFLL